MPRRAKMRHPPAGVQKRCLGTRIHFIVCHQPLEGRSGRSYPNGAARQRSWRPLSVAMCRRSIRATRRHPAPRQSIRWRRPDFDRKRPSIMTSSTAKPIAIAAFETRIIFRHRSATSASSSSRASISEISLIGSSSAIKFEFRKIQKCSCPAIGRVSKVA